MEFYTVLFFALLFFGCIHRLFAPDGNGDGLQLLEEQDLELPKSSQLVTETSATSESSNDGILAEQGHPILLSSVSEFEDIVTPTIAPATPTYDVEFSSATEPSSIAPHSQQTDTVHASVILIPPNHPSQVQSSESNQVAEGTVASEALPTAAPNVVSSLLDSSPKSSIDGEPRPTPPTAGGSKDEEDSITAALTQADEESKPKQEEMPSFDEFKRRVLQEEEEKNKQHSSSNSSGIPPKPKLRRIKERKQSNYASVDCGAKILESNPEASNAESILVENKDLYMLNPCSAKIWFIVELCDLAQVKSIQIANFELFSSTPDSFGVYVSQRYPTRDWTMLGTFQARQEREIQSFPLDEPIYAKYAKIEMLSHFGTEHYCPLSLLRVYGSSMMEELEDHERDGQEDTDSLESDSEETMQVLPPEPGEEMKKESPEQNIFERAADTVLTFVKKFTGGAVEKENGTLNSSERKSKITGENAGQNKQSIVTLMGHEESEEMEPTSNTMRSDDTSGEKSEAAATSVKETLSCEENEDEIKETACAALTPCQLFVHVIGYSSLRCLMGRLLIFKKQNQNITAVGEKIQFDNSKTAKKSAYNKSHTSRKDEMGKHSETSSKVDSLDQDTDVEEKVQTVVEGEVERITSSLDEAVITSGTASLRLSSSSIEIKRQLQETIASPLQGAPVVDVLLRTVQPSHSLDNLLTSSAEESDTKTPLLPSVTVVTSSQENSTPLLSPSLVLQSRMPVAEESDGNIQDLPSNTTQGVKESSLKQPNSQVVEPHGEVKPSETRGIPSDSNDEEHERDKVSDQPNEAAEAPPKHQVSQSECKAPNSLGMMSEASPDIDILETKLTDREGREGMAQLPKADSTSKHTEGENIELEQILDSSVGSVSLETESEDTLVITSPESTLDHVSLTPVLGSQSLESSINPAKSSIGAIDVADSILPLAAPPVITDASLGSQDVPSSSDAASFDAATLSKVQQGTAAATSAGGTAAGSSSGTHKESIFVRLSNKIKALEQNLNMSTLYMEQLNQRYRKSLDEMQKNLDKKVALLTNATKKAELVINGQKEQISKLQSMVDDLTNLVTDMKSRMEFLNKEVMERHIIGLFIEVILILVLFTIFRRRYSRQAVLDIPRDPVHLTNGHGPPRLANKTTSAPRVLLSGREQLLRSFGKTAEPEVVGASMSTDACNNKQNIKPEPYYVGEGKKKRTRRGSKQANRPDPPPDSPVSLTSRTAGLLFFSARGLLGGLSNPWKARKTPASYVESVPSEGSCFGGVETGKKAACMTRAKSVELVPEKTASKKPPPPPPPPPPQMGVMIRKPPDCCNSKKCNAHSIPRGPMKYGKYGVLDTQLA